MDRFPPTSWSTIQDAGKNESTALETLCGTYWTPVFLYIRQRGHDAESARDLTQSFFTSALENGWIGQAQRERGKFRSFLLVSVRHFLANEWDRSVTQKRGGGKPLVSLDAETLHASEERACAEDLTPEIIFDRQCALALLESAFSKIEQEYAAKGQDQLFEHLKPFLSADQDRGAYEAIEASTQMSGGALRVAVHRLRQRYAELLREVIAQTVSSPAEIDEEIRYLLSSLGDP